MQRPRRTSEIQEDPGVIKRQSRIQQRSTSAATPLGCNGALAACTGGTAKKYNTRQSRIAVSSRPSSNDRIGSAAKPYLTLPSSTVKRGMTPQRTPLPKITANRVLFTAEKHNDRKWVQEQTHRITNHLMQSNLSGGTDFLNRGLRQMSIKQFVGIVNYFLGYIWGNRFTVGNNHVDDIINVLQKLQYPYPLNKSWLKTPNTQHSFGNVIVVLDFLMDFVPPGDEAVLSGMYFDLKLPEEADSTRVDEQPLHVADLKFQQELLENSERGFLLWDKQKTKEFEGLKLHTCNILIQKMCGMADLKTVELEIEKLQKILKSLENERVPEDREMQKLKSKLSHELNSLHRDSKTLQDMGSAFERDVKDLRCRKMNISKEVNALEVDIKYLQDKLNTQSCTIEQRDQIIAELKQHKQMLAIKHRAIQDIQNRYNREQVLHSQALKKLTDQIESFNSHMREVKFSGIVKFDSSLSKENLEISLRPNQTELDRSIPLLEKINKCALQCVHENKEKIIKLQIRCNELTTNIDENLHQKLNALRAVNANNVAYVQKLVHSHKQKKCNLIEETQKVKENLIAAYKSIDDLESAIKNKKSLAHELAEANEQTMQEAEQKHRISLEQRKSSLKKKIQTFEEWVPNGGLEKLAEQVQLQEKQLEELRKLFSN